MTRLGRPNGEFAWDHSTISIAYSLVCDGKTQLAIIAEAIQCELPEISRSSLSHYLSYFSTRWVEKNTTKASAASNKQKT
jgi:hypothetical protein